MPWAYLTQIGPGPIFTGVEKPMKVYSFDNVIIASAEGAGRSGLQDPRPDGEEQGRPDPGAAGTARMDAGFRLQAVRRAVSSGRAEVLQGTQSRGQAGRPRQPGLARRDLRDLDERGRQVAVGEGDRLAGLALERPVVFPLRARLVAISEARGPLGARRLGGRRGSRRPSPADRRT